MNILICLDFNSFSRFPRIASSFLYQAKVFFCLSSLSPCPYTLKPHYYQLGRRRTLLYRLFYFILFIIGWNLDISFQCHKLHFFIIGILFPTNIEASNVRSSSRRTELLKVHIPWKLFSLNGFYGYFYDFSSLGWSLLLFPRFHHYHL